MAEVKRDLVEKRLTERVIPVGPETMGMICRRMTYGVLWHYYNSSELDLSKSNDDIASHFIYCMNVHAGESLYDLKEQVAITPLAILVEDIGPFLKLYVELHFILDNNKTKTVYGFFPIEPTV